MSGIDGYGLKGCTLQGGPSLEKPLDGLGCHCTGPRGGQPVCPCQMRHVQIVNGRYVRVVDLGPAPTLRIADLKSAPTPRDERYMGTD